LYGDKPVEEVIKEIYESVFNREPDPEGLNFYKEKVEKGEFGLEDVMLRVLDGAKNDDAVILEKKVEVAHKFVEAIYPDLNGQPDLSSEPEIVRYEGFKDAQEAREWLKKVVSSPDAPIPDINEIKVDLLAIADPDDPIVDEVKELMLENPEMVDKLEDVITISPDEEMLQIVDEIKSHMEQVMNQFAEQIQAGEHPEELPQIDPEVLEQIVSKLGSIKENISVVPPEGFIPEGVELPEGMDLPEGVELPEEMALPEGMEFSEGAELPEGTELPEGVEIPENVELPEGITLTEGEALPSPPVEEPVVVVEETPEITEYSESIPAEVSESAPPPPPPPALPSPPPEVGGF